MRDLLAMATPEEREEFEGLWLGYTETFGAPDLREAIAGTYMSHPADNILCFADASEGIFAANAVLIITDTRRCGDDQSLRLLRSQLSQCPCPIFNMVGR